MLILSTTCSKNFDADGWLMRATRQHARFWATYGHGLPKIALNNRKRRRAHKDSLSVLNYFLLGVQILIVDIILNTVGTMALMVGATICIAT